MSKFKPEKILQTLKINSEPDPAFKEDLRNKIINMAKNKKQEKERDKKFMNNMFEKKSLLGLAASIAVLLLLVVIFQSNYSSVESGDKIVSKQGFGKLPTISQSSDTAREGGTENQARALMSAPETATQQQGSEVSRGSDSTASITIAPPDTPGGDGRYIPPKVNYTLNAELPEAPGELWVYRNLGLLMDKNFIDNLAQTTGLNFFKNFNSALVEMTLSSPNSPYRYHIDRFGRFSMWTRFNISTDSTSRTQAPPDSELISIAKSFLDQRGIDTNAYGEPYVDDSWKDLYYAETQAARAEGEVADKMILPVHQINVFYPMPLDGRKVVSYNGREDPGLTVSIDITNKKVRGLHGRWNVNKEKSLYPSAEQEKVRGYALRGGLTPLWGWAQGQEYSPEDEEQRQVINIVFDKVELAYLQQYKYSASSNTDESYWIPVYLFQGKYTDQNGNEQNYNTLVPAVQGDFFEEPPVRIMESVQ